MTAQLKITLKKGNHNAQNVIRIEFPYTQDIIKRNGFKIYSGIARAREFKNNRNLYARFTKRPAKIQEPV